MRDALSKQRLVAAHAAAALLQAAWFGSIAAIRTIDIDEGAYAVTAARVAAGELPYLDLFWPQMPLFPFVYGGWTALFGETWLSFRALSVLFAIGTGNLVLHHVLRRSGNLGLGAGAVILFAFSTHVLGWLTVGKTYSLSTFLLVAAFVVASGDLRPRTRWLVAGMLVGLAVDARLVCAVVLPAFAAAAFVRAGRKRTLSLAAGLAVGLLPSVVFLVADPARFWFDNVGYHRVKTDAGLVGEAGGKLDVAAGLLGVGSLEGGSQFLLLSLATLAGVVLLPALGRSSWFAPSVAGLLVAGSFVITPTHMQYFVAPIPFLVVAAIELADGIRVRLRTVERRVGRSASLVFAGLLAAYVALSAAGPHRFANPGADRSSVEAVADAIRDHSSSGDLAVAYWPGYLFGSETVPLPGLTIHSALWAARTEGVERSRRFKLASPADVEAAVVGRRAVIVVHAEGPWGPIPEELPDPDEIEQNGYEVVLRRGPATVFRRGAG